MSPPASTVVPQVGSLAHRSQSDARFVDRGLPFLAQMRAPRERRILLAFEQALSPAGEAVEVGDPVQV